MPSAALRSLAALLAGALAAAPAAAEPSATRPAEACFHAIDNRALTFEVYQQAPPPILETSKAYPFFPATAVTTQNLNRMWETRAHLAKYYFQWANRSTQGVVNPKGQLIARKRNFQPAGEKPRDQRTAFTTTERADACTLAQTAAVLGRDKAGVDGLARAAGVKVMRLDEGSGAGLADATDLCVVQNRAMPADAAGVLLDYEVQDGRTPAYTLAFLTRFADLVHAAGKKAILLTNALDGPSQAYTGVTAENANQIANLFDRTTLFAWARNAQHDIRSSVEKQLAIVTHNGSINPSRLIIVFELANTTLEDARTVRDLTTRHGMAGVMFWRDYAKQGGECDTPVNQKIACLAFGRCG